MNPPSALSGAHLRTFQTIYQHPISHNLGWLDVHALFRQLGTVDEEHNGNFKVTRNGQTLVLLPPRAKDVDRNDEVMRIRRFLTRSEHPAPATPEPEAHWLMVIDHHQARIFQSDAPGTHSGQVLPHDPADYFRQAHNSIQFTRGKEKPDLNSYFEPIALALKNADQILIFGNGKGNANEMDQFVAWMEVNHPDQARRIAGSVIADTHHLTDSQLLEKARDFYAARPVARTAST